MLATFWFFLPLLWESAGPPVPFLPKILFICVEQGWNTKRFGEPTTELQKFQININ